MRSLKVLGIILTRRNFSEKDKLLTVFTPGEGKVIVLAKGMRRLTSRRAPDLELFNEVRLVLHHGKTFPLVTESQVVENFSALRQNLKLVGYAYYLSEVLDRLLPERQKHEEVYQLFRGVLLDLSSKDPETKVKEFVIRLLWELGYIPKGQYPKLGVTDTVEGIIERKIKSRKFIDQI